MTTTDKLTNAELFHYTHAGKPSERLMARELLAHRRASQAAPAPSDALREAANSALNEAREKIAERRNACPPGPLFKAFNEAMGDIDDVRFALSASPAQEVKQ